MRLLTACAGLKASSGLRRTLLPLVSAAAISTCAQHTYACGPAGSARLIWCTTALTTRDTSVPAQNYFARISRGHGCKPLLIFLVWIPVGNHRIDGQA